MNQQATIHIGVFFDGTGNNQANATATLGSPANGSYANARSNIALLHELYPTGKVGGRQHLKLYVQGIGTNQGQPDSLFAQVTGRGGSGVMARVEQALATLGERLAAQLRGGAGHVAFDLFGFSRGAAAARHMANRLGAGEAGLPAALQGERSINFIGLFDTVAAIVAPLRGNFDPANTRYDGLRLGLGKQQARQQVQLVAGDERRRNFPLLRSENDIVVPGVHSDIGGGYLESMQEQVMLSKPGSNRVPQTTPVERTAAYAEADALLASDFADLADPRPRVLAWEESLAGNRARWEVAEKQVYAAVYREREVYGHLSRVYLSIMRELAVRAGVPFAALGHDPAHQLPAELQPLSRKLHDYALGACPALQFTEGEDALLRGKYVHTSAHWNAFKGLRNSALDYLYVDRPAQAGRVMHDNPVDQAGFRAR
ncbi:phospholipase effector Tle1 domain-containing protein [Pseudomonas sp. NPDC089406]|uniref:phospholipase effector Tle1 domain-containing protein n=1 Tax=Pseudomonas sp. NPDC089406 TaxID=3364463 RepID=UPI00384AD84A